MKNSCLFVLLMFFSVTLLNAQSQIGVRFGVVYSLLHNPPSVDNIRYQFNPGITFGLHFKEQVNKKFSFGLELDVRPLVFDVLIEDDIDDNISLLSASSTTRYNLYYVYFSILPEYTIFAKPFRLYLNAGPSLGFRLHTNVRQTIISNSGGALFTYETELNETDAIEGSDIMLKGSLGVEWPIADYLSLTIVGQTGIGLTPVTTDQFIANKKSRTQIFAMNLGVVYRLWKVEN